MIDGRKLRKLRQAAGVSQADVARKLGVGRQRVSIVETGARETTPEWAQRYLQAVADIERDDDRVYVHVRVVVTAEWWAGGGGPLRTASLLDENIS